jgi:hypothetical protein
MVSTTVENLFNFDLYDFYVKIKNLNCWKKTEKTEILAHPNKYFFSWVKWIKF